MSDSNSNSNSAPSSSAPNTSAQEAVQVAVAEPAGLDISTKPKSAHAAGKKKVADGNANEGKKKEEQKPKKPGMIVTDPVKGTRDFPPDAMRIRNWLFDHWKEVGRLYGFQEFDAPILEHEDLYKRKAGEEITDQMYNFKDKADRAVALRPELTPSLARIILGMGSNAIMPLKWFSIPQCWRFENTTRGRNREHYQWNMDVIGVPNVAAEAELLSAIVTFFKRVGLTSNEIGIKVNSRKVLQSILETLKVPNDKFYPTCVVVDKLDKKTKEEITEELVKNVGLPEEAVANILNALTVKSLDELIARVGSEHAAIKELQDLWALATGYGIADWLQFDASVVRGLAYYTGVVFEGFDKTGGIGRAICGGGRYDRLFEMFGATGQNQQPCAGFGFGDAVILEILKDRKLLPDYLLKPAIDDVIAPFNESLLPAAMSVANILRAKGRAVDLILNKKKNLGWAYSYADRLGASRVVLIAPTEWEQKTVKIKDLRVGGGIEDKEKKNETIVKLEDL